MRCTNCNVDLGEEYAVCPLCGSKVENIEPLIPGQRTAEYPVIAPKKQRHDAFFMFLIIWAAVGVGSLVLYLFNLIDISVFGCIVMGVASIWAIAFRPMLVKQLYFGNYLAIGILPLSAFSIFLQQARGKDTAYAYSVIIPCLFAAAMIVMLVAAAFIKKSGKRAAPYGLLFGVAGIIGAAVCTVSDCCSPYMWLCETAVCVLATAVIIAIYRDKAVEEIKAKFSI